MKVNTVWAAKKFGVSDNCIRALVTRQKKLTDLAHTQKGKSKHRMVLDSKEVQEFKNTHRLVSPSHNKWVIITQDTSLKSRPKVTKQVSPATGIFSRLDKLEDKLDRLIAMWS